MNNDNNAQAEMIAVLYSPHAEEAMIGAVLINPKLVDSVDLSADDFYVQRHAVVWRAIKSIMARGMDCDFVTLGDELHKTGKLEDVGGPSGLMKLVTATPSSLGAESYAAIIRDKAARRRVLSVAQDMAALAFDQESSLDDGIASMMTSIVNTSSSGLSTVHWSEYMTRTIDMVSERAKTPNRIWGIKTSFDKFDFLTGGLQKSELLILSGEPGVGKSIFVMQMATQMAANGSPGAVYSLEMRGEAVTMRSLSAKTSIKTRSMKSGYVDDDDWPAFFANIDEMSELPIYMSDDVRWTTTALRADVARLKSQHGIEWIVIDYGYLLQDGMGTMSETERTQLISASVKGICKSCDVAGIMIHSMNKSGMQQSDVGQSALRGSAQVQYDADVILLMTAPDKQKPELVRCTFGKGREIDSTSRFFDLERGVDGVPVYREISIDSININGYNDSVERG